MKRVYGNNRKIIPKMWAQWTYRAVSNFDTLWHSPNGTARRQSLGPFWYVHDDIMTRQTPSQRVGNGDFDFVLDAILNDLLNKQLPVIWETMTLMRRRCNERLWLVPYFCIKLGRLLPLGPRFNIKMSSYQYRKSHCGDKTVVRSSYLHNGISYTGKMPSLYWIGA